MKKQDVAKKMLSGKGKFESAAYTGLHGAFKGKKGKGSLNPVQKSKDNMIMEHKNEVENN